MQTPSPPRILPLPSTSISYKSFIIHSATRGLEPISYKGALLSTLLHAISYRGAVLSTLLHATVHVYLQFAECTGTDFK
jgi:hypothetical protein